MPRLKPSWHCICRRWPAAGNGGGALSSRLQQRGLQHSGAACNHQQPKVRREQEGLLLGNCGGMRVSRILFGLCSGTGAVQRRRLRGGLGNSAPLPPLKHILPADPCPKLGRRVIMR